MYQLLLTALNSLGNVLAIDLKPEMKTVRELELLPEQHIAELPLKAFPRLLLVINWHLSGGDGGGGGGFFSFPEVRELLQKRES